MTEPAAPIRVLIVEDEPIAAKAHADYVARVGGFEVVGLAHTAAQATRLLGDLRVDLILLDLNLPDGHGLDLVRALRSAGSFPDVMAVTSARDLAMVRAAVAIGVGQYLLKPFTASAMREKLLRYAQFRERVAATVHDVGQGEVDRALALLRGSDASAGLPKGLIADTLGAVIAVLQTEPAGCSAAEVAGRIGASRVTARRYLEHLADQALVGKAPRYGSPGRPELAYRWPERPAAAQP